MRSRRDICLSTNLDDYSYPAYGAATIPSTSRRDASTQRRAGASNRRSRHVNRQRSHPTLAARGGSRTSCNYQKKATTINGFSKAPALLSALQNNITTDMSLST